MEPGQCLLVLGPSGSGKSTLALALAGLVPRERPGQWWGTLEVGGLRTNEASPAEIAAHLGVVFQDPGSQLVMERVEDDVAFGLENRGWRPEAMRRGVADVLDEMGLLPFARGRSTTLSGGQQQRMVLAGALAPEPSVLVLDEPTSNLDPAGAVAFAELLARLRAERRTTIVLIEHRVELVWPLADRLLVLGSDGRPIDAGAPEAVVRRSGRHLVEAGVWLPEAIEREILGPEGVRGASGWSPSALVPRASRGTPLTARDVRFGYVLGAPVIDSVDLDLAPGERVVLLGANGSGKSTLGRLLVGLLRPWEGRIALDGSDPARLPPAVLARRAGYLFQDPEYQFLANRVQDEVEIGLSPAERARVEGLMAALNLPLEEFADRSPYALSGGEQRRLSLACLLVRRPGLLVLDEPTFGQDRAGYAELLRILRERVAAGTTILAATHDLRFVRDMAARAVVLERGRIAFDGPAEAALEGPVLGRAFKLILPDMPQASADEYRPATGEAR